MTGQSVPYRIPDPAPLRDGPQRAPVRDGLQHTPLRDEPQRAPGRAPEPSARQCTRCGGVSTHYLTCPGLRLPPGYRFTADPR